MEGSRVTTWWTQNEGKRSKSPGFKSAMRNVRGKSGKDESRESRVEAEVVEEDEDEEEDEQEDEDVEVEVEEDESEDGLKNGAKEVSLRAAHCGKRWMRGLSVTAGQTCTRYNNHM